MKKHISKADKKKLAPLTRYWQKKLWSDNWMIISVGVVLGFLLGKI